jgi:hypothetical protein
MWTAHSTTRRKPVLISDYRQQEHAKLVERIV